MISSAPFFIFFFGKGSRGCQQLRKLNDEGFPVIVGHGENPGIHADRVQGTGLDTIAAIYALKQIDSEFDRHFLSPAVEPFACLNYDAVGRTIGLTHKAGDTFNRAVGMGGKTVPTTPAHWNFRLHFRVMADVKFSIVKKVSEKMAKSGGHSFTNLNQVEAFLKTRSFPVQCLYFGTHVILSFSTLEIHFLVF
jgi:hypothetical protein